jgi:GNAT superfamily N-acetyltransferase
MPHRRRSFWIGLGAQPDRQDDQRGRQDAAVQGPDEESHQGREPGAAGRRRGDLVRDRPARIRLDHPLAGGQREQREDRRRRKADDDRAGDGRRARAGRRAVTRLCQPALRSDRVEVEVTTWQLEMTAPSDLVPAPRPDLAVTLIRAERPSPELNRFLYTAVGGHWYWLDRLPWTYARWLAWLSRAGVETWVAYVDGTPAGYFELDATAHASVELAYFGLLPAFTGRGVGGWLLTKALRRAWALGPRRVWVHTCSLDGPHALANYRARGMRVCGAETALQVLPDQPSGPWPGAGTAHLS